MSANLSTANRVFPLSLHATHKFVLLALALRANNGPYCWPSLWRIGADTDLSRSQVKKSLRFLRAKNLIARVKHPKTGKLAFRINFDQIQTVAEHQTKLRAMGTPAKLGSKLKVAQEKPFPSPIPADLHGPD